MLAAGLLHVHVGRVGSGLSCQHLFNPLHVPAGHLPLLPTIPVVTTQRHSRGALQAGARVPRAASRAGEAMGTEKRAGGSRLKGTRRQVSLLRRLLPRLEARQGLGRALPLPLPGRLRQGARQGRHARGRRARWRGATGTHARRATNPRQWRTRQQRAGRRRRRHQGAAVRI